jgi:hypothetical protein
MSEVTSVNEMTGAVVLTASSIEALPTSEAGQPNGIATLDSAARLSGTQMPTSVPSAGQYGTRGTPNVAQVWSKGPATDITPEIQAAIDAGVRYVRVEGSEPCYLNTALFLDSEEGIEGGQAQEIRYGIDFAVCAVLGPGLPTTTAFAPDTATQWWCFPNTKRTALSAGVVTCSSATTANGGSGAGPMLLISGIFHAEGCNRGLVFGNHCATLLDHCFLSRMKYGLSWAGYSDRNCARNVWLSDPEAQSEGAVPGCWLIYQFTNGDATTIEGGEATGDWSWYHGKHARGAHVSNVVGGGIELLECDNVRIDLWHDEMFETHRPVPGIKIINSHVSVNTVQSYSGQESGGYFLVIADEGSTGHQFSTVTLNSYTAQYHAVPKDTPRQADIYLESLNPGSRLIVHASEGRTEALTGATYANCILMKASESAVQEAIEGLYGFQRAITASASWELAKGPSGWAIGLVGASTVSSIPAQATPAVSTPFQTTSCEGTLTEGSTYKYCVAVLDDDGAITAHSGQVENTAPVSGALTLNATLTAAPAALMIWRKKGAGSVLTEAEQFAVVPVSNVDVNLFDSGACLGGIEWTTTKLAQPGTIANVTTNTGSRINIQGGRYSTAAIQRELWLPMNCAGNPVPDAEAAVGEAFRAVFHRMVTLGAGTLEALYAFVGATASGKTRLAIFDVGEANAGEYTALWESEELELTGASAWSATLGNPKLKMRAGRPLMLAIMNSGTTATFGTPAKNPITAGATKLPTGFLPYTGMYPKVVGKHKYTGLSFGGVGATLKESELEAIGLGYTLLGLVP